MLYGHAAPRPSSQDQADFGNPIGGRTELPLAAGRAAPPRPGAWPRRCGAEPMRQPSLPRERLNVTAPPHDSCRYQTVDKPPVMPFARREGGGGPAPAAPQACRIAPQSAGRVELAGRGIRSRCPGRSFADSTSVTAVTSPCPAPLHRRTARSSPTETETAGGSVLPYATSAHLRALSAAEVQSSKSRDAVHAWAHERNLPGRDATPNSPGRQAPRRAEQDVTLIGQRRCSCRAALDALRLGNNSSPPAAPATSASSKPI